MIADIPVVVWPALVAAIASVCTAIIGNTNRRKLNGLREIERQIGRMSNMIDRLDRELERHYTWHMIHDDGGEFRDERRG